MSFRTRSTLTCLAVGALTLAVAAPAHAEGNGGTVKAYDRMSFEVGGKAAINWHSDVLASGGSDDSPLDTNNRSLNAGVPTGGYVAAYSAHSTNLTTKVTAAKNLSFDVWTPGHTTGGAPRISVIFKNGDVAYLAASACNNPIAVSGGDWGRADFTGALSGCQFPVTGATEGTYAADGTRSAFAVYAAAHPTQVISTTFLVEDEAGTYAVDRLALGTGFLYNNSTTQAYPCYVNESRC